MNRLVYLLSSDFWSSPGFGPQHPLRLERLQRTHELLEAYDAFSAPDVTVLAPRLASEDELATHHTREYIAVVRRLSAADYSWQRDLDWWNGEMLLAAKYGLGPGDNPAFAGMYELYARSVGGALMGAELLAAGQADVAFNVGGGLHHGGPDYASGFCIFSDVVIAIRWLVAHGLRVAYVDMDVHHADGVQNAFFDTDRVLTISLHETGRVLFPGTGFVEEIGTGAGEGYCVNLPFPPLTDGSLYLPAFEAIVPPLVRRFAPDVLVTQLGADTHYRDPLADLRLTTADHLRLHQHFAALSPGKWLALGGGGYDLGVVPRSWALAFSVMRGEPFPDLLPAAYRERYLGEHLIDPETVLLRAADRAAVAHEVDEMVAQARRLHGV